MTAALTVDSVHVDVRRAHGTYPVVTDVAFAVAEGEALGIVGESGSGKSLTLRAIMDILPPGVRASSIELGATGRRRTAMVFQEPLAAMNPTRRVQDLIADGVMAHQSIGRRDARLRAVELMHEVGIPHPEQRARMWPHELSGGLRQRVVIAMALATDPQVLLCDEPTTALDVTVQDQILGLLDRLRRERGVAIVFVTHDLAVVATLCQRIAVMYAGQIVEIGTARDVLERPAHPYTAALLRASRARTGSVEGTTIGGAPPSPEAFGEGCRFVPRCPFAEDRCRQADYQLQASSSGSGTACVRIDEIGDLL
jgi:oligopeptide/dipeptide ABC transporter ATP-binding protein